MPHYVQREFEVDTSTFDPHVLFDIGAFVRYDGPSKITVMFLADLEDKVVNCFVE